ncbi:DUF5132 domain-containing protein [Thermoleptolyngbya oregonensis NK1-22]|uniref:DUF5132 domain-containing protein n=1 Tax=Thermoleptolyngbya oregonensis NK1-22 TaxID=2547457 RepID=A0AA97BCG3_9CYAN|nr:DUF5132 domain-containing protein [Thermoleptolyngbya oregonensis NK1-22]
MFELESLLLGLEPVTAVAIGAGAILLAPLVDVLGDALKEDERLSKFGDSVKTSARQATKDALVWGIDLVDNVQSGIAEAQESFNDLLAEAREARDMKRAQEESEAFTPRSINVEAE